MKNQITITPHTPIQFSKVSQKLIDNNKLVMAPMQFICCIFHHDVQFIRQMTENLIKISQALGKQAT